ncbi:homoserine O-acetyltransferase MetX [Ferroacidibacillus organovorans]|nr:homoserine O-acetyltransferase [Ferroacidibacillus organovorans]
MEQERVMIEMSENLQDHASSALVSVGAVKLENGETLNNVVVYVEWVGDLLRHREQAILLCHALTGDAHAFDTAEKPGWWGPLIGAGRALDTERHVVLCMNVLGGCSGTTGPLSMCDTTGQPYAGQFPEITIRDMVRVQHLALCALGITRLYAVLGGSMGGMQALEWACSYPSFVLHAVVLAAPLVFSAIAIGYNAVMRQAIERDPAFHQGDYGRYGVIPKDGLTVARMLGMITYRTASLFEERFGRSISDSGMLEVERYLVYHGEKLVSRFDANSYLRLLTAMDGHHLGRDRGTLADAFARITARVTLVGIQDDLLYPPDSIRLAACAAREAGVDAVYKEIASVYGHDAFLLEFEQLDEIFRDALARAVPRNTIAR